MDVWCFQSKRETLEETLTRVFVFSPNETAFEFLSFFLFLFVCSLLASLSALCVSLAVCSIVAVLLATVCSAAGWLARSDRRRCALSVRSIRWAVEFRFAVTLIRLAAATAHQRTSRLAHIHFSLALTRIATLTPLDCAAPLCWRHRDGRLVRTSDHRAPVSLRRLHAVRHKMGAHECKVRSRWMLREGNGSHSG